MLVHLVPKLFWESFGKIKILSTHNVLCRECADVCRKMATSCSSPNFHNARRKRCCSIRHCRYKAALHKHCNSHTPTARRTGANRPPLIGCAVTWRGCDVIAISRCASSSSSSGTLATVATVLAQRLLIYNDPSSSRCHNWSAAGQWTCWQQTVMSCVGWSAVYTRCDRPFSRDTRHTSTKQ